MSLNLPPVDTRVFLFHSPNAATDPGSATDRVNEWLGKDRSTGRYPDVRVREISVTPDGQGGVYMAVIVTLGDHPETKPTPPETVTTFDANVESRMPEI